MTHLFQKACPTLAASDIGAILVWYRDKLGFTIAHEGSQYGVVHRDSVELHFWLCSDRHIAENTSAYIRVGDIDAAHAAMTGASDGGRISGPSGKDWGTIEFEVWDPDGNLLRFGQARTASAAA